MCGIIGGISDGITESQVNQALDLMRHRGPDQKGVVQLSRGWMGHARLSILDLSDAGRQPMTNEDQTVWLVFNGEIYNFSEIRAELIANHTFRSRTDTEVILHGYEQWGIAGVLARVRGMFSFALWDHRTETLHLARDLIGKKPLFYTTLGGGLKFASTLPSLLALLESTPPVAAEAVLDFLVLTSIPAPRTIFDGVQKLLPGHRLEFHCGGAPKVISHSSLPMPSAVYKTEEDWLAEIDQTLQAAVRDRLQADVPVGAFLSGGIDSSLVSAMMTRNASKRPITIAIGFRDSDLSELPHARKVAKALGTEHHENVLDADALAVLPAMVFHYGEPFGDHAALPSWFLGAAAAEHVKVILSGDGGDELFAGYSSYLGVAVAELLHGIPGVSSGRLASILEGRHNRLLRRARWIAEFAKGSDGSYVFDPLGRRGLRSFADAILGPSLRSGSEHHDVDAFYRQLWTKAGNRSWLDRALYVDLSTLIPDDYLVKLDVATMAHSVEARCPFLDARMIELAQRIPSWTKVQRLTPKYLLRKLAERYLPKPLTRRPKHGFSPPTTRWIQETLQSLVKPLLLSPAAKQRGLVNEQVVARMIEEQAAQRADHGQRLWLLLLLELWCQMFIDKSIARDTNLKDLSRATAETFPSHNLGATASKSSFLNPPSAL